MIIILSWRTSKGLGGTGERGIYFRGTGTNSGDGLIINMKLFGEVIIDEALFGKKVEVSRIVLYNTTKWRGGNRCVPVL